MVAGEAPAARTRALDQHLVAVSDHGHQGSPRSTEASPESDS